MNNILKKLVVAIFIIGGCILGIIFNPYFGIAPISEIAHLNISMLISKVIQFAVLGAIIISILKNWSGIFGSNK